MSEPQNAALIRPTAQELGVPDLIRAVELLRQGGQSQASSALYATWIEHNPEHPLLYAVLFNHAVTLSDAEQLEPARQCLQRAIELNADFMPAYINLGRIHERLGSVGAALAQWSAALARMSAVTGSAISHKTTTLNQSARALEAAEQDAAAEQMLQSSLELDSSQREAIQQVWGDTSLPPAIRVSRTQAISDRTADGIRALLDDEQRKKYIQPRQREASVGTGGAGVEAWTARAAGQ